jgi:hypothetical protein
VSFETRQERISRVFDLEERPYIDFDILKIKDLKERYEENQKFIAEGLPCGVNFNSPKQIREVLGKRLDITTENVKIEALERYRDLYDHDSEAFDFMNGLVLFLKNKYMLNNYINCILKHEENGRVYLRHERGEWVLPNKRPLSESPEIKECIIGTRNPKRRRTNYGSKK